LPATAAARRGILVIEPTLCAFLEALPNLVHLRHDEGRRSGGGHGEGPPVGGIQRREHGRPLVDERRFQTARFSGDVLCVANESGGAAAAAAHGFRHHQIDFNVGGRAVDVTRHDPRSHAIAAVEPRGRHRRFDFWRRLQHICRSMHDAVRRSRGTPV
jgi:hypothetical protein